MMIQSTFQSSYNHRLPQKNMIWKPCPSLQSPQISRYPGRVKNGAGCAVQFTLDFELYSPFLSGFWNPLRGRAPFLVSLPESLKKCVPFSLGTYPRRQVSFEERLYLYWNSLSSLAEPSMQVLQTTRCFWRTENVIDKVPFSYVMFHSWWLWHVSLARALKSFISS